MKTIKAIALVVGVITAPISQAGEIIDFTSMADKLYDTMPSLNIGEKGFSEFVFSGVNFDLKITGGTPVDTDSRHAYLDKGHAGLGVCGTLDGNDQCNPASDDNVTGIAGIHELLTFVFTPKAGQTILGVVVDNLWINNSHDPNPSGQITSNETVMLDGVSTAAKGNGYAPQDAVSNPTSRSYNDWDGSNGTQNLNASVVNSFSLAARDIGGGEFGFTLGYGGTAAEQFYVSGMEASTLLCSDCTPRPPGEVPVPSPLVLLGAGLMGLGFARRGNKKRA